MKPFHSLLLTVTAISSIGLAGCLETLGAVSKTTIESRGIRIVGAGEGTDFNDSVRPFNWHEGTSVALLIRRPEGNIIDIDRDASKVTRFVDSAGTDLLKKEKKEGKSALFNMHNTFGMMPQIKKDGRAAMIELGAPRIPVKGATGLEAVGSLKLVCASTKKVFKQAIDLKVGTKVSVGPVPFEIIKIGKPQWGNAAMAVTFKATKPLDSIHEIRFSSNGKEIETKSGGQSSMEAFGVLKIEKTINFVAKADAATIEISAWQDMKRVDVPFDLKLGLGF